MKLKNIFKKKQKNIKGYESKYISDLIKDLKFINANIKNLDFFGKLLIYKNSLNVRLYYGNGQIDIQNIDLDNLNLDILDMIYIYNDNVDVQLYSWEYKSHFVSNKFITINKKNGTIERIVI